MLDLQNLSVTHGDLEILSGLTLQVAVGERAAIMGPNGGGKSTLANVLAGNPAYTVSGGTAYLNNQDLLVMSPEERAANGLFLAFQYPPSLPGVPVSQFLRLCLASQEKAQGKSNTTGTAFIKRLRTAMQQLDISAEFAERGVNEGMSGGEKKRLEMLQLLVLRPSLVILDEIDSGLDIDALRLVASAIDQLDRASTAILIITHYQRLLEYLKPDSVHVLQAGTIVRRGTAQLAEELEKTGYSQ